MLTHPKHWLLPLLLFTSVPGFAESVGEELARSALKRTEFSVVYDGSYRVIPYPGGDVPANLGVCTDVVIRAYRGVGIDLQQRVHEDMLAHFDLYPSRRLWGLRKPDTNIDHRRVPNLQRFFERHGTVLAVTSNPDDYQTGDIVTWKLPRNLPHIGIVIGQKSGSSGIPLIVHNIGRGPEVEDGLFAYSITGHYRYPPDQGGVM
ncbi:MAG: DUF1287 domain-containing protein [Hahellaceae bacterium]|nr:DUF1287 domain-containing protein [Hahellaceae bacterium]MCP5169929.1 DUF1287 domain-containing protein [Hahellaceae bacterium]